jgi:hypothetical protein
MSTCRTCKFLAPEPTAEEIADGRASWVEYDDDCEPQRKSEHRRCLRIIHGNRDWSNTSATTKREPAIVTDGSGYAAALRVLPDVFGCSLWEPLPRVESDPTP